MKNQFKLILRDRVNPPQGFAYNPSWLREQRVNSDLQGIFNHSRDYSGKVGRAQLQARVGINLQEPGFQARVQQKIVAKNLEVQKPAF